MKSSLIRPLVMGVFAFPLWVTGQQTGVAGVEFGAGTVAPTQAVIGQPAAGNPGTAIVSDPARYSDPGNNFTSNVPINELSAKAYRQFHRRFKSAATGEFWFKWADGYKVSFLLDQRPEYAYFDRRGEFRYSLTYFDGKDIPRDPGDIVKIRYPGYRIGVVTRVNDGTKTFYTVQIINPFFVKTLTVADGRVEEISALHNGGGEVGPAEAAR